MKNIKLLYALIVLLFIFGCSSETQTDTEDKNNEKDSNEINENQNVTEENVSGGELRIALNASPPTLDQHITTAAATRDAASLIYEGLLATNSKFEAIPMLAESVDTEDNKKYTFKLREGVKFHNGKEMVAEDVIASMERWGEKSSLTGNVLDGAKWSSEDEYKVVLELSKPSSLTLDVLASPSMAAGIMPKEVIDGASVEGVNEYIGTGPFKFEEWKDSQYIHFKKFDEYKPVDIEADGLTGKKEALVDDLYIYIVPDTSTRLAGMRSGEYHVAYDIPLDQYETLQNDPDLSAIALQNAYAVVKFNTVEGLANNFKLREAINTALDVDEIMMAGFPNKELYTLDASYMHEDVTSWRSEAGSEYYNQNDPEKAKQMLEDLGYDGEEFRIMATRDYDYIYNIAVVLHEQLQEIGINSKLNIYDWPTVVDMRENDTDAWEVFISGAGATSTPIQLLALSPSWGSGVNSDYVLEKMEEIQFAPTIEEAKGLWDELQLYAWEEHLPVIQLGGLSKVYAISDKVNNFGITLAGTTYWNVTVSEE